MLCRDLLTFLLFVQAEEVAGFLPDDTAPLAVVPGLPDLAHDLGLVTVGSH
jgi:hypothetical protein